MSDAVRYKSHYARTSFWIVSLTKILFECGSVHMNPASISFTLLSPFSFLRQMASNCRLSGSAIVHVLGGDKKRSQLRQKLIVACFGIPSVISTELRRQGMQRFAGLGSIGVPGPEISKMSYVMLGMLFTAVGAENTANSRCRGKFHVTLSDVELAVAQLISQLHGGWSGPRAGRLTNSQFH
jgi:hypothetical protein